MRQTVPGLTSRDGCVVTNQGPVVVEGRGRHCQIEHIKYDSRLGTTQLEVWATPRGTWWRTAAIAAIGLVGIWLLFLPVSDR